GRARWKRRGDMGAACPGGRAFHARRPRRAGARRFADFRLLVPGGKSVRDAHDLAEAIEAAVREAQPRVELTIHIEPIEEQASWMDNELAAFEPGPGGKPTNQSP